MTKQSDETAQKVVEAWQAIHSKNWHVLYVGIDWTAECKFCSRSAATPPQIEHTPDCPIGTISAFIHAAPAATTNETAMKVAEALLANFNIGIRTPNWRDDPLDWKESTVEQITAVIADALKQAVVATPGAGTWSRENQQGLDYAVKWLREQGNPDLTAFNAADYLEGSARPLVGVGLESEKEK